MLRFLGFLFLLTAGVGTWGWCKGWFKVEFDHAAISRDLDDYELRFQSFVRAIDDKITSLRDRARTANAKSKPELEREISELEGKRDAAAEARDEYKSATPEERAELKKKLDAQLQPAPKKDEAH
jgi:hypothetical protein